MITVVGISGSVRKGSYNSAVLRAAASLMPADSVLAIESIAEIPLYNGDDEQASGIPAPVTRLKDAIAGADGVLLVTPKYNNSIPGVTKNAIDWLSRPPADIARVFGGKPFALAGASPGGFGTLLSQNAWLPVFRTLGVDLWPVGACSSPVPRNWWTLTQRSATRPRARIFANSSRASSLTCPPPEDRAVAATPRDLTRAGAWLARRAIRRACDPGCGTTPARAVRCPGSKSGHIVHHENIRIDRLHRQKSAEPAPAAPADDEIEARHVRRAEPAVLQPVQVPLPAVVHEQVDLDALARAARNRRAAAETA